MGSIISGAVTLSLYALIVAAVWRLFQMAADLGEIKTILADIRRDMAPKAVATAPATAPAIAPVPAAPPSILSAPMSLESAEALLREVAAESPQQAKTIA